METFTCLECGETFLDHGPGGARIKFCKRCHCLGQHVGRFTGIVAFPSPTCLLIERGIVSDWRIVGAAAA